MSKNPVEANHVWLGKDNEQFTADGIAQMIRNMGVESQHNGTQK